MADTADQLLAAASGYLSAPTTVSDQDADTQQRRDIWRAAGPLLRVAMAPERLAGVGTPTNNKRKSVEVTEAVDGKSVHRESNNEDGTDGAETRKVYYQQCRREIVLRRESNNNEDGTDGAETNGPERYAAKIESVVDGSNNNSGNDANGNVKTSSPELERPRKHTRLEC
eukprot:7760750-Pyramimonas_sp.AAC.1